MIDFIGDIHGHADKLKQLLTKMNYEHRNGAYFHPDRKVVFLGDYIDRGPQIKETLDIVRRMVDNGNAIALMGNHEYNAICYNTIGNDGQYLRDPSLKKNKNQHQRTLEQFADDMNLYHEYTQWFYTLPLFYETDAFRAVHATWDLEHIGSLTNLLKEQRLSEELIHRSADESDDLFKIIEEVLKGRELTVPSWHFFDEENHKRDKIRIKWWVNPVGMTYRQLSILPNDDLPNDVVDSSKVAHWSYYEDKKPVFFGHYWMTGTPALQDSHICCADFSVAKKGVLASYRFNGETVLNVGNFRQVS